MFHPAGLFYSSIKTKPAGFKETDRKKTQMMKK
jgi:hypothetical protein